MNSEIKYQRDLIGMAPSHVAVTMPAQNEPTLEPWTCQYVLSILVNIFCFSLPCSTIGTMHLLAARADAVRGYTFLSEKKRRQAVAWTASAFGIGCAILVIYITMIIIALGSERR